MNNIEYQDVVNNVKRIISEKWNGYKQVAIAEKCGYEEKEFSNMLNGRKKIQVSDIPILSVALGVEPNEFFKKTS